MFFRHARRRGKSCEAFLKERFEIVRSEIMPTRKLPAITDEPIIWRYFLLAPLRSALACRQLDESVRRRNGDEDQHRDAGRVRLFERQKIWGPSRRWASPRTSAFSTVWRNTRDTRGRRTGVTRPTRPAGGAARIRLRCSTTRSYTTARSRLTMPTAASSKCSATNARCQTDTEVITYILDYITRIQGLTLEETAGVIAAPFWSTIDSKRDPAERGSGRPTSARCSPSLLITGPFSIVLGFDGGLMALNDRLKLRSMVRWAKGRQSVCRQRGVPPSA